MKTDYSNINAADARRTFKSLATIAVVMAIFALPETAIAQDFEAKTCEFLTNITDLLGMASIAVVTIGIIFAGYQIAFAHKRISDVAPILIGALLIGAAGQLATWIIGNGEKCEAGGPQGGMALAAQLAAYVA